MTEKERCPECGSWERECGSPTPVNDCGCVRCAAEHVAVLTVTTAKCVELAAEARQSAAGEYGLRVATQERLAVVTAELEALRRDPQGEAMTDDICANGCAHFRSTYVMPGWVCCQCRCYNGLQRTECRNCSHTFCGPAAPKPVVPPEEKP